VNAANSIGSDTVVWTTRRTAGL